MQELPTYKFGEYTFRPALMSDLPLAREWNAKDPEHTWEWERPYFWIEQTNTVNSYVLADWRGIIFFMKTIVVSEGEIEISIQFDRTHTHVSEYRAVRGMAAGFDWLKKTMLANTSSTVYFKSKNTQLTQFAETHLGFRKIADCWVYDVTADSARDE